MPGRVMRVAVIGGGPAGLYFSALWKRRHPADQVRLIEQNAADATWGFGVVFSDQALEFLRDDDPDTVDAIAPHMQAWRDIAIVHRGQPVVIDGVGFSAIGRLQLLQILQGRAREAGVALEFGHAVQSMAELADDDLIVAADGVSSLVRRAFESEFGCRLSHSQNTFAWYGTTKRFDTLTQTFVANEEPPVGIEQGHLLAGRQCGDHALQLQCAHRNHACPMSRSLQPRHCGRRLDGEAVIFHIEQRQIALVMLFPCRLGRCALECGSGDGDFVIGGHALTLPRAQAPGLELRLCACGKPCSHYSDRLLNS